MDIYDIDYRKTVNFTGHRPSKLNSYDYRHPDNLKILKLHRAMIERLINKRGIDTFISGMALGIDMWSAQIILQLKQDKYPNIKLVCAIPCIEHYKKWNQQDIDIYHEILGQADLVYYVSEEPYTNWCMIDRDKWMVDNSSICLAVWNGVEDGGTWQTIKYAKKRQRTILHLHTENLKVEILNYK